MRPAGIKADIVKHDRISIAEKIEGNLRHMRRIEGRILLMEQIE
ncbi:hypothetical protein [Paenibacillus zanthoxyli]